MCKKYVNVQNKEILDLNQISILKDNAMLKVKPELWCEWDFEKNNELGLDIWKITKGSNKKAWWTCSKDNKHTFECSIKNRMKVTCPYCTGRYATEENNLLSRYPEVCKKWDYTKNDLTPDKYTPSSDKKVYWYCKECESSYDMRIKDKVRGVTHCPYCSNKRVSELNCLATINPKLSSEWHPTKNGKLTPNDVLPKSNKKVWWLGKCGHEWEAMIGKRSIGRGCHYCTNKKTDDFNNLAVVNPELANEWHPTKNGELTPNNTFPSSGKKVWWLGKCGHEWEAVISNRAKKINPRGCPYCSGKKVLKGFNDLWTTHPEKAKLLKNIADGFNFTNQSNKKVEWKCSSCGNSSGMKVINSINSSYIHCDMCSNKISTGESFIREVLKFLNIEFIFDKNTEWSNRKRYDFFIPSLNTIIEVHGIQHYEDSFTRLGGRTSKEEKENDKYKKILAKINGIDNYYEIDARDMSMDSLVSEIKKCKVLDLDVLSEDDFKYIYIKSKNSLLKEICDIWNSVACKSVTKTSKIVGFSRHTVSKYLKMGDELGWVDYK